MLGLSEGGKFNTWVFDQEAVKSVKRLVGGAGVRWGFGIEMLYNRVVMIVVQI